MTLLEHGACAKLFMFFESQRWRLYETGQTIRLEEEAAEGGKTPWAEGAGLGIPGKPDSSGDVARGAVKLRRRGRAEQAVFRHRRRIEGRIEQSSRSRDTHGSIGCSLPAL
jgi:hypothetical protein